MSEDAVKELTPKDWSFGAFKTFALLGIIGVCFFIYGFYNKTFDTLMYFLVGGGITICCLIGIVFSFIFGIAAKYIKISMVSKKALLISFSVFVFYLLFILVVLFIDTGSIDIDDIQACVGYGGVCVAIFTPIYTWLMVRKAKKLEKA